MNGYGRAVTVLHRLLDELNLFYLPEGDHIVIPFVFSEAELFEEGTPVNLIASWGEDRFTIEVGLLELYGYEQETLDPSLMSALLAANYEMDICKFALAPYGLALLVDFDTRNLQPQQLDAGIVALLDGFDLYVAILEEWFRLLAERGDVLFPEYYYDEELFDYYDDEYFYEDLYFEANYDDDEFVETAMREADNVDAKGQAIRALIGVANLGVKAATLAGIASVVGVPAAGIGALLAAVAQQHADMA